MAKTEYNITDANNCYVGKVTISVDLLDIQDQKEFKFKETGDRSQHRNIQAYGKGVQQAYSDMVQEFASYIELIYGHRQKENG